MLSGRSVRGDEAERIGLVDRLVDGDVVQTALNFARRIARLSAPAAAAIVECVDAAFDLPHDDGMAIEGAAVVRTFEEGEAREGIAAFVAKREPVFD
jgi:enoyl-CoA hydratase